MPTFVLTYRTPTGYTPTPETASTWMAWFEGMSDALVDMGKPVISRNSLGNCSSQSTQLGGYSVIQADDLETATVVAKGCPHLSRNGGVEIGQLGEIPDVDLPGRRA
jgi:hypothetical protein